MKIFEKFGHTIDLSVSGSGSIDPWTSDYARENGVSCWGTCDMGLFALVDGEKIFKMKIGRQLHIIEAFKNEKISSWDEALTIFNKFVDRELGLLSESKHSIDIQKMQEEKIKKLTKKEKEAYFENVRKERQILSNMPENERKAYIEEKNKKIEEEYQNYIKNEQK